VRILAVTTKSPLPLNEGRALRTYNLLRELASRHEITLCSYVQSEAEVQGLEGMRGFCAGVHAVPLYLHAPRAELFRDLMRDLASDAPILAIKYQRRAMVELLRRLRREGRFDVLHLDMLHLGLLAREADGLPTVLVEHNVETALLERREQHATGPMKSYLRRQVRKLGRFEASAVGAAQCVVTCSDNDAELLRKMNAGVRTITVPNAVDIEFFKPTGVAPRPATLIYVGGLGWFPNLDAIEFMARDILPRIQREMPGVTLTVVGQVPDKSMLDRFADCPSIRFAGLVEDIRPFAAEAVAYVVPLRIGGGTRLKILDAFAMGRPVVSTSIGCEGLRVQPERDILVADDAESFARATLRVLRDPALAKRLGEAGRDCVVREYQWSGAARLMDRAYDTARAAVGG
jgi:glycosyltransferase involved in cell wall biosynthesis